jgi:hypothetical protein
MGGGGGFYCISGFRLPAIFINRLLLETTLTLTVGRVEIGDKTKLRGTYCTLRRTNTVLRR